MRSVLVHLDHTSEGDVAAVLDGTYERHDDGRWMCYASGDPCLYINFYRALDQEFEPNKLAEMKALFTDWPPVSVIADVSGRHDGRAEARQLVSLLLGRWRGVVTDEAGLLGVAG